jgi:cation transport ATPase
LHLLVQKAQERKLGNLSIPANFHEVSGVGVEGEINGEHIAVGSRSFFEKMENESGSDYNDI